MGIFSSIVSKAKTIVSKVLPFVPIVAISKVVKYTPSAIAINKIVKTVTPAKAISPITPPVTQQKIIIPGQGGKIVPSPITPPTTSTAAGIIQAPSQGGVAGLLNKSIGWVKQNPVLSGVIGAAAVGAVVGGVALLKKRKKTTTKKRKAKKKAAKRRTTRKRRGMTAKQRKYFAKGHKYHKPRNGRHKHGRYRKGRQTHVSFMSHGKKVSFYANP